MRGRPLYKYGGASGLFRRGETFELRNSSSATSSRRRSDRNSAAKRRRRDRRALRRSTRKLSRYPSRHSDRAGGNSLDVRRRRGLRAQDVVGFLRPTGRFRYALLAFMKRIGKTGLVIMQHRPVGAVEPDDRRVAGIDMIVPAPARRRDQIARLHRQRLAFDDRGGAMPFDDEADGAHRMTMRGRELAGANHLRAHEQACARCPTLVPDAGSR